MRLIYLVTLLTGLIYCHVANADTVDSTAHLSQETQVVPVLQVKFGRLYLSQGTEALILPGCPVRLLCGDDTLPAISIAQSYQGMAISEQIEIEGIDSLAITTDCIAIVTPATIDTVSPIVIGTDIPADSPLKDILIQNDSGTAVQPVYYKSRTAMLIDYEQGVIDGYLSYRSAHIGTIGNDVISKKSPYIAALAPNPSRSFNQEGAITTSLYYRFDPDNISSLFEGDNLTATTRFFSPDTTRRPYRFDGKKGERLFRSQRGRPRSLRIFAQDKSLQLLRSYYADILSRDRCRVTVVDDPKQADISFLWHLSPAPGDSLTESFYMSDDTANGLNINESIRLLHNLLAAGNAEISEQRRAFLFEKADRVLANDIGYFALFRPAIFLTTTDQIINIGDPFGKDGRIQLSKLGRVILPVAIGSGQ